jgi:hypothetical protein
VLGAAVHDWPPGARAQVLQNVRTSDLTDPQAAATWQAIEHLAEHNAPIDQITVSWQTVWARGRFGDGLRVQELRATRGAAFFHHAGAATLAMSTMTRVASRAMAATSRCAEDLAIDLTTVIDSVETHQVAVAAAAQRLTGEHLAHASLAAVKKRLLDGTRQPAAPALRTVAIDQSPVAARVDRRGCRHVTLPPGTKSG